MRGYVSFVGCQGTSGEFRKLLHLLRKQSGT